MEYPTQADIDERDRAAAAARQERERDDVRPGRSDLPEQPYPTEGQPYPTEGFGTTDDRTAFEEWQAGRAADRQAVDDANNGEESCPHCGATDANPSHEVLPHCWRCGYAAGDDDPTPTWPPTDLDARREAVARRRVGL